MRFKRKQQRNQKDLLRAYCDRAKLGTFSPRKEQMSSFFGIICAECYEQVPRKRKARCKEEWLPYLQRCDANVHAVRHATPIRSA